MVSALLADALGDPTQALIDLYGVGEHDDFSATVTSHFSSVFGSTDAFQQVRTVVSVNHNEGSIFTSI
jgi:hypothetical protein